MEEMERKISLIKDKVQTIIMIWNLEKSSIHDKAQLLKELVDIISEYRYLELGKDYSAEPTKFNIVVSNNYDLENDILIANKNSTGREIIVLEEDLKKEYEIGDIMTKFIAKLFKAVSMGIEEPRRYIVLNDIEPLLPVDRQIKMIYSCFDKTGNVKVHRLK